MNAACTAEARRHEAAVGRKSGILIVAIADRTREYLGTSGAASVRAQRMVFVALRQHADGKLPFGHPWF